MMHKNFLIAVFLLGALYLVQANQDVSGSYPRECYSCEGINCQRTTKQNDTTRCTDMLDICVTIFDGFTVTARGCYEDLPETQRSKCDQDDNLECSKCFGQRCNDKGREDFKCIVCKTNDNNNCAKHPSKLTAVQCPAPTTTNAYCFIRDIGSEDIVRGCSTNLEDQLNCMHDNSCSLCLSDDGVACNTYDIVGTKSSATRVTIAMGFILLLAINLVNSI